MDYPMTQRGESLSVISAPASPVKVRPVDPGGMKIPYRDITVLNPEPIEAPKPSIHLRPPPEEPIAFPR